MRERHPSIHALVIAPKTFEWIYSQRIGNSDDDDEQGKSSQYPRTAWTVLWIRESEGAPATCHYFNENAEGKILTCDEREEERLRNQEWNEREEEYGTNNSPPESLLEHHGGIVSSTALLCGRDAPVVVLETDDVLLVKISVRDFHDNSSFFR